MKKDVSVNQIKDTIMKPVKEALGNGYVLGSLFIDVGMKIGIYLIYSQYKKDHHYE